MKKSISLILILCAIACIAFFRLPANAYAADIIDSGNCGADNDNVKWSLDSEGCLFIWGSGGMKSFSSQGTKPWDSYLDVISSIIISEGVTNVSNYAFRNCSGLTFVSLPAGVTSIGSSAFENCGELVYINFPDSLVTIGSSAFYNCKKLESISIPSGVTNIGSSAFRYCESITGAITIPDGITTLNNYVFYGCKKIKSISLPDSLTSIEAYALCRCESLEDIKLSSSLTSISIESFGNCKKLTSITLPQGVKQIASYAFTSCTSLEYIYIPSTVSSIWGAVFAGCTNLSDIEISSSNKYYRFEDGILFNYARTAILYYYPQKSGEYVIPSTVKKIDDGAFYECELLTDIQIPATCTYIGERAFYKCTALSDIVLPESVTTIERMVFQLADLQTVTFEGCTTSFDYGVFAGNDSLTIIGPSCSDAHVYAVDNNIPFAVIEGDSSSHVSKAPVIENLIESTCLIAGGYDEVVYCNTCGLVVTSEHHSTDRLDHSLMKVNAHGATCTEPGCIDYWVCTMCGSCFSDAQGETSIEVDSWIIPTEPALGHDMIKTDAKDATCTKMGNTEYWYCSRCETYYGDQDGNSTIEKNSWIIAPKGHIWGDPMVDTNTYVEPTCTTQGGYDEIICCTVCSFEYQRVHYDIAATGHTLNKKDAVSPTCETAGNSDYWTCSKCDKFFSDAQGTEEIEEDNWVIPAAGHTLVKTDANEPTCEEPGNNEYWTCSVCGKYFNDVAGANEIEENAWVIAATDHDWTDISYYWKDDDKTVTAIAHCSKDRQHILSESVETVAAPDIPATCETAGSREYTASFTKLPFTTQTKTVELPPTGHDWKDIAYTWADGNGTVTAQAVCGNNEDHKITETVDTAYIIDTQPTCVTSGSGTYTAIFKNSTVFESQSKDVVLDSTGHTLVKTNAVEATCEVPGNTEYWTCSVCGSHFSDAAGTNQIDYGMWVIPADHNLKYHEATPADCVNEGTGEYWSCGECGRMFSDELGKTEIAGPDVIPATGHRWTGIEYTWAEDNSKVTARGVCENDPSHTITETVDTTYAIATQATCETVGCGIYIAPFAEPFTNQIKNVEIPAVGHAWAATVYTWAEDNSKVTALKVCGNDHAHDISETVDTVLSIITPPTCDRAGRGEYTAYFTNLRFETQKKSVDIPASHTLIKTEAIEAGCDSPGISAYWTCSKCGRFFSDAEGKKEISINSWVIPAGHSYKLTGWTWAEDYTKATAAFVCERDGSHTAEIEATVENGMIVTDDSIVAKKYEDVEKEYKATVVIGGLSYEDTVTETLKATHKVHEKKTAKDGAAVDLDVKTDTLEVTIAGEAVSGAAPVLVASYDEDGRFLGLEVVTEQTEKPLGSVDGAESVKIFWVNAKDDTPRCEDEEIKRNAE